MFNRYGHRGVEKLASLINQSEVGVDSGGSVSYRGSRYVAIAPLLFQRVDGKAYLAFRADTRGRITHMFTGERIARVHERVPGYATARAQLAVLGACGAVFLWSVIAPPVAAVFRRVRSRPRRPGPERRFERLGLALGGLNLIFLLGLGVYLTRLSSRLETGVPPLFVALLTIPLLALGLTAALLLTCARAWSDRTASWTLRLRCTLVTAAALLFVAWLAQWNLIGYRF